MLSVAEAANSILDYMSDKRFCQDAGTDADACYPE